METAELMGQSRDHRLAEVGTEPECPLCGRPRVTRSCYIRCNPCGVNWLDEEMHLPNYLQRDPRVVRREAALMVNGTRPTAGQPGAGAE